MDESTKVRPSKKAQTKESVCEKGQFGTIIIRVSLRFFIFFVAYNYIQSRIKKIWRVSLLLVNERRGFSKIQYIGAILKLCKKTLASR